MARVIKNDAGLFRYGSPGRPTRYPWETWFDGRTWELVHGEDFASDIHVFRSNVQTAARKHGGMCRTAIKNGRLFIKFLRNNKET